MNYVDAFNDAVMQANRFGRTMRLAGTNVYGRMEYSVTFAVGAGKRFGEDARGEFIEPGTAKMTAETTTGDSSVRPVREPPSFSAVVDVLANHRPLPTDVPAWLRAIVDGYGARRDAELSLARAEKE